MKKEKKKEEFVNPIDKDKIAENPHLLPYASNIGSAIIQPIDKGKVKGLAMNAMYEQTDVHLTQLREQVETLIQQAKEIHERVEISESIYLAEMGFEPIVGRFYHLYLRKSGKKVLSMIAPNEWGRSCPYEFEATVKLLSDHTWEVLEVNK